MPKCDFNKVALLGIKKDFVMKDIRIYLLMQSIFSISSNQFCDLKIKLRKKYISWKLAKEILVQRNQSKLKVNCPEIFCL